MHTHEDDTIVALMREPEQDIDWLKRALQAAIKLEAATLPPYLSAMWSIKDEGDPSYATIRGIVMDEMRHMGLACNLLTTIGGTPILHSEAFVPRYPGPLPGGVRPELTVTLAGLSRPHIEKVFMEIEMPEKPIAAAEEYPTIGKFYDAIQGAFDKLAPGQITGQRQIKSFVFAITSHADAKRAIERIKREGEGTSDSPFADPNNPGKVAHYYAFKEILVGRKLRKNEQGKWVFEGAPIPFPDAYPMATVPSGGYSLPEAKRFDQIYTRMFKALEDAWRREGGALGPAIGLMHQLGEHALALIQRQIGPGRGNYGPCFRFDPT